MSTLKKPAPDTYDDSESPSCQRCRVQLTPHKSLTDLKPAQLSLLNSSLQLSADSKKRHQQRIPSSSSSISSSRQNSLSDSSNKNGEPKSEPENKSESQNKSGISGVPWGLSHLPQEAKIQLLRRGGVVGSFVAVPDTQFVEAERLQGQNGNAVKKTKSVTSGGSFTLPKTSPDTFFEIISSKTDIDYPVCSECAEMLSTRLQQKYEDECRERDAYIAFVNNLKAEANPSEEEIEQVQKEIEELELENSKALQELKDAEKRQEELELELKELEKQFDDLKENEDKYFEKRNEFQLEIEELESEKDRTGSMLEQEIKTLGKLQTVNVYNDVFCIGFDGNFGTINGLRLGRLKEPFVEWSEINAAWGQSLLCLATIINKLDYKVRGYKLRPQGSMSIIEKLDIDHRSGEVTKRTSFELYSSGDYRYERILHYKKVDDAMVAFLTVLKQVCDFAQSRQPNFRVPHHINNDKIGEYSIRLSINSSNDAWTRACKYVLRNLKHLLAFLTV